MQNRPRVNPERPYSYRAGGDDPPVHLARERERRLRALASGLQGFARAPTLARIAALQLLPENADQMVRIEALAFAAATACPEEGKTPTREDLLAWLNESPITPLAQLEDPCENMLTDELVIDDARLIYFAGILESPSYYLRILIEATAVLAKELPGDGRIARGALKAALVIANEIAVRLDVKRGLEPELAHWKVVAAPEEPELERLARAVCFTTAQLENMLNSHGIAMGDVSPLVASTRPDWSDYENERGILHRPIVRAGDEFIVTIPSLLPYAARDVILLALRERRALDKIVPILRGITFREVIEDLERLGFNFIDRVDVKTSRTPVLAGRFAFDTDKQAVVIFTHDDLADFSPSTSSVWDSARLTSEVGAALPAIEDAILSAEGAPNEILFVFITSGVQRTSPQLWQVDTSRAGSRAIALDAAHLSVIAHVDAGDPLKLWSFAISEHTDPGLRIELSIDPLTRYAFFRSHARLSVHEKMQPRSIFAIPHELRGELARESARRSDPHGAIYPTGRMVEVRRYYRDGIPNVYVASHAPVPTHHVLVEGFAKPVWVLATEMTNSTAYMDAGGFASTVATWLSRAPQGRLDELLAHLPMPTLPIVVSFSARNMVADVRWGEGPDSLVVEIGTGLIGALKHGPDAQHDILRSILREIAAAANYRAQAGEEITREILRSMPSPLVIAMSRPRISSQIRLPDARLVQEYAVDLHMDAIAAWILEEGRTPGRIDEAEIVAFLDALHAFLVGRLRARLRTLLPISVDAFVFHYESVADAYAKRKAELPFLEALDKANDNEARHRLQNLSRAGVAARFLVGVTAAEPPQGLRPPSTAVYDELLALAALIVNHRHMRDLHAHGTAHAQAEILPSGRPLVEVPGFDEAMEPVHKDSRRMELEASLEFLRTNYAREPTTPESFNEVNDAFKAEWGEGLIELANVLDTIANRAEGPFQVLPEEEVVKHVATELDWTYERVESVIHHFALGPRGDFLESIDTQPWRFGRREAYIMKPLISTVRDGVPHLTWGPLHVSMVPDFILNAILSGRFEGRSKGMKRYIATKQSEHVKFNSTVRSHFDERDGWEAYANVWIDKNFGGPQELGDIDTLALHRPTRTAYVIEVKSFLVARTPYELRNEIKKLFDSEEGAVPVNEARTRWLREHIDAVTKRYRLEGEWNVVPLVVVDRNLAASGLRRSAMPIIDVAELKERIAAGDLNNSATK